MKLMEERICDGQELERLIENLAAQIAEKRRQGAPLCLVGVRTRGYFIAERLAPLLREKLGEEVPLGAVDITLYRDDLGHRRSWPVLQGTRIGFSVEDVEVVLVDDVLFTGRTVRAALNSICDLGRPSRIRLAVVVDRGGRELPIQADFVGRTIQASGDERIGVRIGAVDGFEGIVKIRFVD